MAVLGRLLVSSAERLDLPDLLSIDSFVAGDFKYLMQSFVGEERPYILKGFELIQPQDSISASSISIQVHDSVVYHPTAGAGSFFYGLPEGDENAQPLTPELRTNATNYVYLTFSTKDAARDSRAFWDPDQNGGEGGEFSQDVNTQTVLIVEAGISVSSFPEGTIPVCKVEVGPSVITSITDCRDMMFRLGKGGSNPDPFFQYDWDTPEDAREPDGVMNNSLDPNPFKGGDKNIKTLKEWMDVVMSRIKDISGDGFWYSNISKGNGPTVGNVFKDALATSIASKGEWKFEDGTYDTIMWTDDIKYNSLTDPRQYFFRSSSVQLEDNEIAWFDLIRDKPVNTTKTPITWTNGVDYINAGPNVPPSTPIVGAFENLAQGDWVRKQSDSAQEYRRVEQFYSDINKGGSVTTPALALSIELSEPYDGPTGSAQTIYTKGDYDLADLYVTENDNKLLEEAGGNVYWMANRKDNIMTVASIATTELTLDITEADGVRAKCTESVLPAHGLNDQDLVTIPAGAYAGTYEIEKETDTVFYINTSVTGSESGQLAYYAVITTGERYSTPDSAPPAILEESAAHGVTTDTTIIISDTVSLYDGEYKVAYRSETQVQIPVSGNYSYAGGGLFTVPVIHVKNGLTSVALVNGESISIGDGDPINILKYIGMQSMSQTIPNYRVPSGYNAIDGYENYNCDPDDDLTIRASKLTAMMADRVQDRGIIFKGRVTISNFEDNSGNQAISATDTITIVKPGSDDQVLDLACLLPLDSVAVGTIDRDGNQLVSLSIEPMDNTFLLEENKFVLFYRFDTKDVYNWQGEKIHNGGSLNTDSFEDSASKNITVVNYGSVGFEPESDLITLQNRSQVQVVDIEITSVLSLNSSYFLFWNANNQNKYYVWYNYDGTGIEPSIPNATGIEVAIDTSTTLNAFVVAGLTRQAIQDNSVGVTPTNPDNNTLRLTNDEPGRCSKAVDGVDIPTNFTFTLVNSGESSDIEIIVHGYENINKIDTVAINAAGNLLLPADHSVWIRVSRSDEKIFNTVSTFDVPDTIANGFLYVTPSGDVPEGQDVFVLYARRGGDLIELNRSPVVDQGIYDEETYISSNLPIGTFLTLPTNSIYYDLIRHYIVGANQLLVYLNGQLLTEGVDYAEVGNTGTASNRISLEQEVVRGDYLRYIIRTSSPTGGVGSENGGGGGQTLEPGNGIAIQSDLISVDLAEGALQTEVEVATSNTNFINIIPISENTLRFIDTSGNNVSFNPELIIDGLYFLQDGTPVPPGSPMVLWGFNVVNIDTSVAGRADVVCDNINRNSSTALFNDAVTPFEQIIGELASEINMTYQFNNISFLGFKEKKLEAVVDQEQLTGLEDALASSKVIKDYIDTELSDYVNSVEEGPGIDIIQNVYSVSINDSSLEEVSINTSSGLIIITATNNEVIIEDTANASIGFSPALPSTAVESYRLVDIDGNVWDFQYSTLSVIDGTCTLSGCVNIRKNRVFVTDFADFSNTNVPVNTSDIGTLRVSKPEDCFLGFENDKLTVLAEDVSVGSPDKVATSESIKSYIDSSVSNLSSQAIKTAVTLIDANSASDSLIAEIPAGSVVTRITISVKNFFDGADPVISIGDVNSSTYYVDNEMSDLKEMEDFICGKAKDISDTEIRAYVDLDSSTVGLAKVNIEYI